MLLKITSIVCDATVSTVESTDNLFLMIQADAGPPARYPMTGSSPMKVGSSMPMPAVGTAPNTEYYYQVEFDYGVVVTGYDLDSLLIKNLDSPDFLFNFAVNTSSPSATQILSFAKNQGTGQSQYTVTYELSSS